MVRIIRTLLALVAALILAATGFVLWASTGRLDTLEWVDRYGDDPETMQAPDTLTIMTYNVGYLSGMTNNEPVARSEAFFEANLARAAVAIEQAQPDIVAFQEIDVASRRSHFVDQVEALARSSGFSRAAVAVNWDERYVPFPSSDPSYHFGRVVSAQAVITNLPVVQHRRIVLPSPPGAPLYGTDTWLGRLAKRFYIDRLAQVTILGDASYVAVVNVHLEAWDAETRTSQVDRIVALLDEIDANLPVFVVGDFNSIVPAARHAGRLAPEHLDRFRDDLSLDRLIEATGFEEAMPDSVYASADSATFSYSSDRPEVKIDHLFYDPEVYRIVDAAVLDVAGPPSDHRPVVARFVRLSEGAPGE